jgi:hypothetical protein
LYWDIGPMIVEPQQVEGWGRAVVERLAGDLQKDFPGIQGFSASNLWRMKLFYGTYSVNEKLAPLVREIGWTHNMMIFERCKEEVIPHIRLDDWQRGNNSREGNETVR